MSVTLDFATGPATKIGRDAGWILAFHRITRTGVAEDDPVEFSRDNYYAEITAALPGGLEGGNYTFVIEGLTDSDYRKIALAAENAPRVLDLYLYYRDLELPDAGILSNVLGSDFINAGSAGNSKISKHAADKVARLWVQSVTRKAGSRKYETTITARELVFDLVQTKRACGSPIDARDAQAAVSELMRRAWPYPEGSVPFEFVAPTPRTSLTAPTATSDDSTEDHLDGRLTILDGLQRIAGTLEHNANRHGRGMLLVRNGTLHVGQRTIPLDPANPSAKMLNVSQGLLEIEALGSQTYDPNWVACDHEGEAQPSRHLYRLTLRGRPDLKPGDLVVFDAPPEDASDTNGPLGGVFGALGDLAASVVEGVGSLLGNDGMANPVQLYVSSVEHRLGRTSGFVTTITGVQVGAQNQPTADEIWDAHTPTPAPPERSTTTGPRGTIEEEAADAVVRLIRREAGRLSSTDIAEIREFVPASSGAEPPQTSTVFRGLVPITPPGQSRRADIKRPSDAVRAGVPYLTPFAWGPCGLVLPRYPGMRVAVTHRAFDSNDPIDIGALWQTGHVPTNADAGDWWLIMPAEFMNGNAPAENQSGAPTDYDGTVTHDLIDPSGNRIIEVGSFVIRVGTSTLGRAGQRPAAGDADAITIEQTNGNARIQIKDDGSILIEGASIDIHSRGELKLRGTTVNVE